VGFQIIAGYRVMRFFHEAQIPLGAKLVSRAIRFVYGSDIHWEARIAPGVVVVHGMGMAISRSACVGKGSILFQNITLAESADRTRNVGAPQLGERVHVGPGSALIGPITVGSDTKIVAGSTLLESVPSGSRVEAPPPRVVARAPKVRAADDAADGSQRK
jgi:serine O-acetyltransferase